MKRHEPRQLELLAPARHPALELEPGDVELDRYAFGAGHLPDERFVAWLDTWRERVAAGDARVLVAVDESHAIVVAVPPFGDDASPGRGIWGSNFGNSRRAG